MLIGSAREQEEMERKLRNLQVSMLNSAKKKRRTADEVFSFSFSFSLLSSVFPILFYFFINFFCLFFMFFLPVVCATNCAALATQGQEELDCTHVAGY
jgi:hypothetical protein